MCRGVVVSGPGGRAKQGRRRRTESPVQTEPHWPFQYCFNSDSESEADDLLHENEIAPNIIITSQTGGNIETVHLTRTVEQQKAIQKKH